MIDAAIIRDDIAQVLHGHKVFAHKDLVDDLMLLVLDAYQVGRLESPG